MTDNMTLEDRMFGRFPPDANEDDIRRYYDHISQIHERLWNERMEMHMIPDAKGERLLG